MKTPVPRRRTKPSGRVRILVALTVVALGSALYLPTLKYDFVWDDSTVIQHNTDLDTGNPFGLLGRSFALMNSRDVEQRNQYYRPLVTMSFWADRRLWGLRPAGYHLTNVILNGLAGLLITLMLADLFSSFWPVLLGGLAFAMHPTHVESVAFTAGRTDILMAIFITVAFLALVRFRRRPNWGWLALVAVGYVFALLSKEAAIVFPVFSLFYLGWPLRQNPKSKIQNPKSLLLLVLLAVLSLVYWLIRASVLKGYVPAWTTLSSGQRALLVINAFGRYIFLGIVPFMHKLVYLGPEQFAVPGWPTAAGIVGLAGLVWLAARYRRSPMGLGSAWFVLFILPACNWFPPGISHLAERLLYLPVVGLIVLLTAISRSGFQPPISPIRKTPEPQTNLRNLRSFRFGSGILVCLYIVAMGWDSLHRMPVWQNNRALYRTMAAEVPDSPDAYYNLGNALRDSGDVRAAIREYRQALTIRPDYAETHNNLGLALLDTGDLGGAIAEFREAVRSAPRYALAHENLANGLARAGSFVEADAEYRRTIELQPDLAAAHNNLGKVLTNLGHLDSAATEFRQSLVYEPNSALTHCNLGQVLLALGRPDEAEQEYRQALKIQPDYRPAQEGLKQVLSR